MPHIFGNFHQVLDLMLTFFLIAAGITLICMTLLWILSVKLTNASIVDIFWGMGFVIVNAVYFFLLEETFLRSILILVLVSLWGIRLTVYLGWRNSGKGEDYRYQEFRRTYGEKRYWWVSFFQVFLLQGALIMLISLPLLGAHYETSSNELVVLDYIAILIWIIGFFFETVGDLQMARFKSDPENKGKVMDKGLWKYTRHPNYFGDTAVWWAYGLFCIAAGSYWPVLGSIVMTILIIKVSGVSMLERTITDRRPDYADYIKKTSAFIQW